MAKRKHTAPDWYTGRGGLFELQRGAFEKYDLAALVVARDRQLEQAIPFLSPSEEVGFALAVLGERTKSKEARRVIDWRFSVEWGSSVNARELLHTLLHGRMDRKSVGGCFAHPYREKPGAMYTQGCSCWRPPRRVDYIQYQFPALVVDREDGDVVTVRTRAQLHHQIQRIIIAPRGNPALRADVMALTVGAINHLAGPIPLSYFSTTSRLARLGISVAVGLDVSLTLRFHEAGRVDACVFGEGLRNHVAEVITGNRDKCYDALPFRATSFGTGISWPSAYPTPETTLSVRVEPTQAHASELDLDGPRRPPPPRPPHG